MKNDCYSCRNRNSRTIRPNPDRPGDSGFAFPYPVEMWRGDNKRNDGFRVSGAVFVAEDEQEDGARGAGAPVRADHVVRDVRRAAAVRHTFGRRFPRVRRPQAGRPAGRRGRVAGRGRRVVRGLRAAPVARQAPRVGRHGRGTGPGRRGVRTAGRDPGGFAARGRGHRQAALARRRTRSVPRLLSTIPYTWLPPPGHDIFDPSTVNESGSPFNLQRQSPDVNYFVFTK